MVLIQLLLPAHPSSGPHDADQAWRETTGELAERFEGVTAYLRSPAKGLWTSPAGRVDEDDIVMVEIVMPAFDREWWGAYAKVLAMRFGQEAIHVRALTVEMLDADAS